MLSFREFLTEIANDNLQQASKEEMKQAHRETMKRLLKATPGSAEHQVLSNRIDAIRKHLEK